MAGRRRGLRDVVGTVAGRAAAVAVLWWALLEGVSPFAPPGVVVVAVGTWVSLVLVPPDRWRLRWAGVLRLVGVFCQMAFLGGIDVAWRALNPRMPITPAFRRYPLRLTGEESRVMLAWIISLMPGTVSVALEPDAIEIHVIDTGLPVDAALRRIEEAVAGAFVREDGS